MRFHKAGYVRTDGRVGRRMLVTVPSLLLRTTGHRTGAQRTAALSYARDGGDYVLVASNNGLDVAPGWYFNLCAAPRVEVQVGRKHIPAIALAVNVGEPDYDRLWRLVNDNNRGRYYEYRRKTARPIPVVVVRPS